MLPNSRLRLSPRFRSGVRVGKKQPQHTRQIGCISGLEREASVLNDFPVFGNVASQHADGGSTRVQAEQWAALQIGTHHEQGGIGEQFLQGGTVNPVEEDYLFALM